MLDTHRLYQRAQCARTSAWFLLFLSGLYQGCIPALTTGSINSHSADPHFTEQLAKLPSGIEGPQFGLRANEIVVNGSRTSWSPNEIANTQQSLPAFFSLIRALQVSDDRLDAPGECIFNVAPELPFFAAASAIWTAHAAGCEGIWIHVGAEWLRLREPIKLQSGNLHDQTPLVAARQQIALHVTMANVEAETFSITRSDGSGAERLESILTKLVPRDAFGMTTLNNAINQGCNNAPRPCPSGVWLTAASEVQWGDAAIALAVVVGAHSTSDAPTNITVLFDAHNGSSLERHVARAIRPRLDPQTIQNTIRTASVQWQTCYEQGLLKNPALHGRVLINFVIGLDGRVLGWPQSVTPPAVKEEQEPPLPDANVISCLMRKFKTSLVFPHPQDGNIVVLYPIMFTPGQ